MRRLIKKRFISITFIILVIFSLMSLPGITVEYTAIQLTDNDVSDNYGGVSNGYITWMEGDGAEREIFLYIASSDEVIQITDNDYEDTGSHVDDGMVTWIGKPHDGVDYEVFLYNYKTGTTIRLTDNDLNEGLPSVHEGLVTWVAQEGIYVNTAQIYLYDSFSGITTQISSSNSYANYAPLIDNGLIVWGGYVMGGSSREIFLYDSSTGIRTQITNNDNFDYYSEVNEGLVAWESTVDGIVKLYVYDTTNGQTQYIDDLVYTYPYVLDDGKLAYQTPVDPDFEIYIHNYYDGTETRVTYTDYDNRVSDFHGGKIIWKDGNKLLMFDSATGTTELITNKWFNTAHIRNGFITWTGLGSTGYDYEIFVAKLALKGNVDFDPNTLNLDSKGKWVTVYVELPVDSDNTAADIDVTTVLLNGLIPADTSTFTVGDYDGDGIVDLMVKFDRNSVQSLLNPADSVDITISGNFNNGSHFEGTDTIRVI